jgi:hypothetical protein
MRESCFKLIYVLLHLGIAMAKSLGYVGEKENVNYTTWPLGSCTSFFGHVFIERKNEMLRGIVHV